METKKDFYSINSNILKNLSLEELEERLELDCWYACDVLQCNGALVCGAVTCGTVSGE